MNSKNNLAIITARGGSKRIPKKNIKEFCGKPIIAYSIEAAINSGIFDEVMVSTDSEEIADAARKYGAVVPFMRSEKTSNDYATTSDVLNEVLECYNNMNKKFDYFCCIYPTAPFVTEKKLKEAFELLVEKAADRLIAVTRFDFPPQRAFVIKDGCLEYQYPEYELTRSQDLIPIYHDCGQFYFHRTESFLKNPGMKNNIVIPYIISNTETQDIDTYEDWEMAENKMKELIRRGIL